MPDTVVGLFGTRSEAEEALRKLKDSGFGDGQLALPTPRIGRRGHYGLKVLVGIVVGALLGALCGAIATGMVPGVHPLVPGNLGATFLFAAVAGAATGGVAGALLSIAAAGGRALYYEQGGEAGPVPVSVGGPRLAEGRGLAPAPGGVEGAPGQAPPGAGPARPG